MHADEYAQEAVSRKDFRGAGHPRGHPLQLEESVAVAGRGGGGIREEPLGRSAQRGDLCPESGRH